MGSRKPRPTPGFFDLRESGYHGPINQDGYPVTEGPDAATLKRVAERRGEDTSWWTGAAEHHDDGWEA